MLPPTTYVAESSVSIGMMPRVSPSAPARAMPTISLSARMAKNRPNSRPRKASPTVVCARVM
jgi:hypothetical protein